MSKISLAFLIKILFDSFGMLGTGLMALQIFILKTVLVSGYFILPLLVLGCDPLKLFFYVLIMVFHDLFNALLFLLQVLFFGHEIIELFLLSYFAHFFPMLQFTHNSIHLCLLH